MARENTTTVCFRLTWKGFGLKGTIVDSVSVTALVCVPSEGTGTGRLIVVRLPLDTTYAL